MSQRRDAAARVSLQRCAAANFGARSPRVQRVAHSLDKALRALDAAQQLTSLDRLRETEASRAADAVVARPQPQRSSLSRARCARIFKVAHDAVRVSSLCCAGLQFLGAFTFFSVLALIRLEFDADSSPFGGAFQGRRLRSSFASSSSSSLVESSQLDSFAGASVECPALDYSIVFAALCSELGGVLVARHLVDSLGRRLALGACFAVAAAGALVLATPEYIPQLESFSTSALTAALMYASPALLQI